MSVEEKVNDETNNVPLLDQNDFELEDGKNISLIFTNS